MRRQPGTAEHLPRSLAKRPAAALLSGALAAFAFAGGPVQPALAQAVEEIVIDLSVIGDGGQGAMPGGMAAPGKLLVPPRSDVRSRLYVQPKSMAAAPVLTNPAAAPKRSTVATTTPAAPPQPAPKAAPKPPVKTAAAPPPPKPVQKPVPKPMAKPAPSMDAKAPPATMASKAPPMPPATSAASPPPAAPAAAETASALANIAIKAGRAMQIVFDEVETKLPDAAGAQLNALAGAIRDNQDFRVQLMAYAAAKDLSASKARRISLSRALEVRSFLIDKGVRSTQIDVRALGNKSDESPANRVDVNLAPR
jgi:outer membrane protein OmpA-like peptidoglycan-associated protein